MADYGSYWHSISLPLTKGEPELLPCLQFIKSPFHSARPSVLYSIYVMPPPCCVCMSTLTWWPPYFPPWYDSRSSPFSCPRGHDPVLLIAPGTGAPSPHPHCSPPLAALHLHLLTPSMPSPRSQLSHTAHYPTATHHPSKSGPIFVSQVAQCDVMLSTFPLRDPSPNQTPAWWDRCMGS